MSSSSPDRFVIAAQPVVHVGAGALADLPALVLAAGADQAVVVTDEALATAPVIETVLAVLADAGLRARLFAAVHPVPTPADLAAGSDAVAAVAADAASTAAASASAAAVAAMLTPSAPLVLPSRHSGPHPVLRPSAPSHHSGPHPVLRSAASAQPAGPPAVLSPSALSPFAPPPPAGARIALVAVGSEAAIDAAKGIAAATASLLPGQDPGRPDAAGPALPIVAVPVGSGTGAETSAVGLVTDPADGRTFSVGHAGTMPAAAILDPQLAAALPPAATAGGGLDALTRALASYLAPRPSPWSDGIALQAIRMIAASLPRAVMDGTDLAARSQLMLAAHMAGVAAAGTGPAGTGPGLCHAIGRSLAARRNVARGPALAMLLPEVLRFSLPARLERMAEVAFALGVGDTHADTWLNAEAAIGAVTALRDDVGLNRLLGEFGVTEADFAQISADTLADEALADTPLPPTEADIHAILHAASGHPR